jgi:hypothetical protein
MWFCTGGDSIEKLDDAKASHAVMLFFRERYAALIMKPWVEVITRKKNIKKLFLVSECSA